MIPLPLVIIILLIILLIFKLRRQDEEYKVEGLKISWSNKANIKGNVSKWIFVLKDKTGSEIHRHENSEAKNLKDWTDVSIDVIGKKEFDDKIIGDNTLEIYYNKVEDSKKLHTTIVNYSESDFSGAIDTTNLEEIKGDIAAPPPPPPPASASTSTSGIKYVWFGYENSGWSNRPLNIAEIEVYSGGVNIVKGFGDGKVQSSSIYANWTSPKNLFDGSKSNMAHTKDGGTNYFKINLGKEYSAIDKVFVYNRHNCCYDRWAESFVKLLDKDGNEIARSEKLPSNKSSAANYKEGGHRVKTFTFGNTVGASSQPITQIPHQIPSAAPGGWCNHANAVHQDVPGCGRICSDINAVGRKDKGTWGSWDAYPGSVDCPAAKLDQVWKKEGNSRKLAVGKYSRSSDMTGGFKWYYYEGSYLSDPSSFNNKEYSNKGTGVTDFSNINKATNGALQVNGRDNYAVRWQGRFVPKKTGTHKFWTKSDDMSYLYVNNKKVVDNGGLHGMVEKDGTFNMTKDKLYLIEIFFSEKGGGDDIIVNFKEPNGTKTTNFSGYMIKDTKICSSGMFGGRSNNGITDYKHCLECAHKWEPGTHKRTINCENLWGINQD